MNLKTSSSFRGALLWTIILALILTGSAADATGNPQVPPEKPLKASRQNPKIETRLELIASSASSLGTTAASKHASQMGINENPSNATKVIIEKKRGSVISSAEIRKFGGKILRSTSDLVEIRLPARSIRSLVE